MATGHQRWFVEADQRWSSQHERENAETVADLLLDNFREHAGRSVTPNYLQALQWRHAFVETPAAKPRRSESLWDDDARLGVCGDSVVASQVDSAHRSGVDMARAAAEGLSRYRGQHRFSSTRRDVGQLLEEQL